MVLEPSQRLLMFFSDQIGAVYVSRANLQRASKSLDNRTKLCFKTPLVPGGTIAPLATHPSTPPLWEGQPRGRRRPQEPPVGLGSRSARGRRGPGLRLEGRLTNGCIVSLPEKQTGDKPRCQTPPILKSIYCSLL